MPRNKPLNPFNVVLLLVGIAFVLTACGYSVMTVRAAQFSQSASEAPAGSGLIDLLDKHGLTALIVELGVLAAATFAAIATDGYWARRGDDRASSQADEVSS